MGHDESLGASALLAVFLDEGVVLGNLPLLVVEIGIGLVVLLALRVAVGAFITLDGGDPSAADVLQKFVVLNSIGDTNASFLDVEPDDGSDADRELFEG